MAVLNLWSGNAGMPSLRKAVKRRRIGSIGLKLGLLVVILLVAVAFAPTSKIKFTLFASVNA